MSEQNPPASPPDQASATGIRQRRATSAAVDSADTADVIVVGAGPAGSAAAYHLATAGLDVLMLEKTSFPREKVCGDGLTPRAVKALTAMGISTDEREGWLRNKGLRIIGGGGRIELAELDARRDEPPQRAVDDRFGQQVLADRRDDRILLRVPVISEVAADDVHAGFECVSHGN